MNILGIETSCDETAASVVRNGRDILSNVVISSLKEHSRYGGIIPEIASRRQMELIHLVVSEALSTAKLSLKNIDAIAATSSPGLIGSLLVGISFARSLSFAAKKPLIEVDHIKAHLYASFLKTPRNESAPPKLPAVGLVVSGGHSSLFYIKDFKRIKLLGQTRDDAAGETFDKVARMLKLGYPGGPAIDLLAQREKKSPLRFPCAQIRNSYDFSFSGIKTAVLYYLRDNEKKSKLGIDKIAYAFQNSIIKVLVEKSIAACQEKKVKTLLVGGGVACNSGLRKLLTDAAKQCHINVFFPPLTLCLDNAAMIAGLAYHL